jgi:C_GCAxxG_C_C family probable redox protein
MNSMNHIDLVLSRFAEGFNCSQAVFSSYAERIDEATALKMASGFGGGMGRMAETCGAVTGAMMALGLRFGGTTPDREAKERIYTKIREFADRFKARNGSLACKDLLRCDISTPEGYEVAKEKSLLTTTCPKFVRDAAEILEEMLVE